MRSAARGTAQNKEIKPHSIELNEHTRLAVSGVKAVPVFTDKGLTVELDGEVLTIIGKNLEVKALDVESGKLNVTGYVTALKYSAEVTPKSFIKKVFK